MGNVKYDKENAKNLTPQADSPRAAYPNLVPKYATIEVGIARERVIQKLLSAHASFIN